MRRSPFSRKGWSVAIADDIAAIDAGPGTDDEKRRAKYRIKCKSLYDVLLPLVRSTFRFNQIDWTILDVWLEDRASGLISKINHNPNGDVLCVCVKAVGTGAQAGVLLTQQIYRFTNPPLLDAAAADNRIQAAKEMLADLL
jgi:hypothetical protein